jgi:hypothetical protein
MAMEIKGREIKFRYRYTDGLNWIEKFLTTIDQIVKHVGQDPFVIYIEQGQCVGHEQVYEEYREIWKPITGPVVFDEGAFSFEGHEAGSLPLFAYIDDLRVIGNLFSNPELLK